MCIINTTHGFVFVHVPKSAGTAVTTTLSRLTTVFDLEIGGTPWGEAMQKVLTQRFSVSKHATASELRGLLGVQRWHGQFTFAFVRNPYDRAWSTYKYLLQHKKEMPFIKEFGSFDAYVRSDAWDSEGPSRMLRPQTAWTDDRLGRQIVSAVGQVERLEEDLRGFVGRLGPAAIAASGLQDGGIEPANVSRVPKRGPKLSAAAVSKIAARYERDFERFAYDPDDVPFEVTG